MFDFNEKLCFCYYATSLPVVRSLARFAKVTRDVPLLLKNLWEKDALKVNFLYSTSCIDARNERKTARKAIN